jgi:hypothetical protein
MAPDASAGPAAPTVYVVAPASLTSWFAAFVPPGPADEVVHAGEGPDLELPPLLDRLGRPGRRTAVLLSSHDTLLRDVAAAGELRRRGHTVVAQSGRCAVLGTDKFAMKAFFDEHGFTTPPWARGGAGNPPGRSGRPLVVKRRAGTQSVGTRLEAGPDYRTTAGELAELYVDGVEYSVVAYRDDHGCAVFPPVWKGRTSPALVPPWRRLRLCPFPGLAEGTGRALRRTTRRIADAAGCTGFVEVEYLVADCGALHVLEINPRVSGTMRISAMATGVPIFGMHRLTALRGDVPAVRHAAEVPYDGEPVCDPAAGVVGTSRLTVAADDAAALTARLARLAGAAGSAGPPPGA